MRKVLYSTLAVLSATCLHAQVYPRRANLVGGGNPDFGRCTIEVVVDGAADVEMHGDTATLRNIEGQPPQWRTFECTSPMPAAPANFRFQGRPNRGRQQMFRDPANNGGVAVIRIEDPEGGAQIYGFDVTWNNGGRDTYRERTAAPMVGGPPAYPAQQFNPEVAVRACREEVRNRAASRFGTRDIEFSNARIDDNPGRRDWVVGSFFLRRDADRDTPYDFACSMNLATGFVRSVDINQGRREGAADRSYDPGMIAVQSCQQAVSSRMRNRGFADVRFNSVRVDDRPGRDDWVIGSVQSGRGYNAAAFNFSCRVDLNDGDVRTVDLTRK